MSSNRLATESRRPRRPILFRSSPPGTPPGPSIRLAVARRPSPETSTAKVAGAYRVIGRDSLTLYGLVGVPQACSVARRDDDLPSFPIRSCPHAHPARGLRRRRLQEARLGRVRRRDPRWGRTPGGFGSARASRRGRTARRCDEDGEWPREQGSRGRHGHRSPQSERLRQGGLHGLDHRWEDVRQLGRAAAAGAQGGTDHAVARTRDPRVDRGGRAHGRGREAALLDSRGARLQGQAWRAARNARVRHHAPRLHARTEAAGRRRRRARRRGEDQGRPGERGHAEGHGHRPSPGERWRARELFDLAARRKAPRRIEGQAGLAPGDRLLRWVEPRD